MRSSLPSRDKSRNIGALRFLMRYIRPYRTELALAIAALVFTASGVLGMGSGLRHLVDEGLSKGNPDLLDQSFFVLIGVVLLLATASYARSYFISRVGEKVIADVRKDAFAHVVMLSPSYFETTRLGEILSRLGTDTTLLQSVVGNTITFAIRNLLLLVGGTVLLLITSIKLTSFVFLVLPLVAVPLVILGKKVRRLSRETQEKVGDFTVHIEETLSSLRTVQAYGLEDNRTQDFGQKIAEALHKATDRIAMRSLLTSLVIALVFGAIAMVLWVGGHDVIQGRITPGDLSAFIFYAVIVAAAIGALSEIIGDLQRAAGAAERLVELMQVQPEIRAPAHPLALPPRVTGDISFKNVTFAYPTRPEQPALQRFSLHIPAGERCALVGSSGAGKSTIIQLLLRFYDPQQGEVQLEGIALPKLDPRLLRQRLGLVPQDPVIFSANAWENIRCAKPNASDAEVREAARAAAALEFLEALPEGFNSYLGEKGIRLSGGQKQRVAIARAILKNPAVLLLDEATSALDSENEQAVQQALERLMQGRTTIMIAHRLSTIRMADRIVVLHQGRIEAEGTHEQLMQGGGLYARLSLLQAA
jgi:ATP-binding cassette subfamily B protein